MEYFGENYVVPQAMCHVSMSHVPEAPRLENVDCDAGQVGTTSEPPPKKGRRKKKPLLSRKEARNSGQAYYTVKGKYVPPKVFKYQTCECKYKCKSISSEEREAIFKQFWATKCWETQENIIASSVTSSAPKRRYAQSTKKQFSRQYYLNNKRVCKNVFLSTLSISSQRMNYCITKKSTQLMCIPDQRGKVTPNKTSEEKLKIIQDFLDSIPKMKSPVVNDEKIYFKEGVTRIKLYREYQKIEVSKGRAAVSKPVFNASFKKYGVGIYGAKPEPCQNTDGEKKSGSTSQNTHTYPQLQKPFPTGGPLPFPEVFSQGRLPTTAEATYLAQVSAAKNLAVSYHEQLKRFPTQVDNIYGTYKPPDFFTPSLTGGDSGSNSAVPESTSGEPQAARFENVDGDPGQMDTTSKKSKKKKKPLMSRKEARNSGQAYYTLTGKYVPPKVYKYQDCECLYKCKSISTEEREAIFKQFWATKSWETQENIISSSVTSSAPKRRYAQSSKKQFSRQFFLNKKRVCKSVFLATLGISNQRLHYCITKKSTKNMCIPDQRGKVTPNKTSEEKLKHIQNFLDSVPKFESPRSNDEKFYLKEGVTRIQLYREYKEYETSNGRVPVSKPVFNNVFKNYNTGIYVPKTDTCQICDAGKIKLNQGTEEQKFEIRRSLDIHLDCAEDARSRLNQVTEESKADPSLLAFTFSMQREQPLPRLQKSVVLHKRQLWVQSVGINNLANNQGHMAMWDETEGKRGLKEICSVIAAFLNEIDTSKVKRLHTFSESCEGQGHNLTIISFFMWMCDKKGFESWEHTYMESGHSYLPNDKDFSIIEKKAKGKKIFSKEDWIGLIENSMTKQRFHIVSMKQKFLDVELLPKLRKFWNPSATSEEEFSTLKLKSFVVHRNSPTVIYQTATNSILQLHYPMISSQPDELHAYFQPNPISKEKYSDLLSLLPYVPPIYHGFYKNLPHNDYLH